MDIHSNIDSHTCKMEHEDDSENDRADKMDIHQVTICAHARSKVVMTVKVKYFDCKIFM